MVYGCVNGIREQCIFYTWSVRVTDGHFRNFQLWRPVKQSDRMWWIAFWLIAEGSCGFRGGATGAPPKIWSEKKKKKKKKKKKIPFCIRMLKNKAQIARESIKNPESFQARALKWALDPGRAHEVHTLIIFCAPLSENQGSAPGGYHEVSWNLVTMVTYLKVHRNKKKQLKFAFILVLGNFSHSFRFLHYFFFILTK